MFNPLKNLVPFIAIDLGTSNIRILSQYIDETILKPSVIAINTNTKKVVAVGKEAKDMIGKTPPHIKTYSPLEKGVISDFDSTEGLIKWALEEVAPSLPFIKKYVKPNVIIAVPTVITEVEVNAVVDAARYAGARKVFIVEEPMAASVGANLALHDSEACLIVDIGGGTTDIAIISLGGIVIDNTKKLAGVDLDEAIVNYVKQKYNLLISSKSAEEVKKQIGTLMPSSKANKASLKGQDILNGLPKSIEISDVEISEAISPIFDDLVEKIKEALEKAPPELMSDIIKNGITLCGGGSLVKNLDKYISKKLKLEVNIPLDPDLCVILGLNKIMEDENLLNTLQIKDLILK